MLTSEEKTKQGLVAMWTKAIAAMDEGAFRDAPSREERLDWMQVYRMKIDVLNGEMEADDAFAEWARCNGRWFLAREACRTELPRTGDLSGRIRSYATEQRNLSVARGAGDSVSKPSKDEIKKANREREDFHYWYDPIEVHQRSADRAFLMLAVMGRYADMEMMGQIVRRGQNVHQRLLGMTDTVKWLPPFRYECAPIDREWHDKLFGKHLVATLPSVLIWWQAFTKAHQRFLPTEPTLPAREPVKPFGNFGERDDQEVPF